LEGQIMVHILASFAFTLVAVATLGLTVLMLLQDQDKIMTAIGLRMEPVRRTTHRRIRVRTAGRWQVAAPAEAHPRRVAA
jgi:hypothetical protein